MTQMKYQFLCISCALILLIVVFWSLTGDVWKSESSHVLLEDYIEDDFKALLLSAPLRRSGRSILSLPHKHSTSLVAALDGTIHLVENGSMRVIWSFPTGSPIYSSYQGPVNKDNKKENVSELDSEFMECGDDWALYIQSKHFGKMRLSTSVADFVAATPIFSDDGAVTLGSKRSTLFEVDAITGRIFRSYADGNASILWSDDMQSVTNIVRTKNKELVDLTTLSTPELLLKIIRTDYSLKAVEPRSGKVLWTMTVAEFNASLDCKPNENLFAEASFDFEDKYVSDSGLDFTMPYACHDMKEVFRLRKNFLLQPAIPERLHENPSAPTSDLVLPSQSSIDKFLHRNDDNMMLPTSVPKFLPSLQQNMGSYDSNDDAATLSQPPTEITAPGKDDLNRVIEWSTKLSLIFFMLLLLTFLIYYYSLVIKKHVMLKYQSSESEIKGAPLKEKRARKSRKNNSIVDKKDKHLSSEEKEDVMTLIKTDREARLHFNKVDEGVDGRRIGKLFVSNKEIAKGSNGTIVLEGRYEGRAVAVKRLVQAHHDVALKEIQNLIASDCHPNIVRWYGVEHDQDFVYLALERCTCSLNDLIQIYRDLSENSVFSKDQASRRLMKTLLEIEKGNLQDLWKANGYPSPLLLKLMRDVVSGLVHLHDLGIIHRDMKPQNVLIIKERSLGAKLSDMGISKRLLGDMSSLGHNATGCGSSGWQAPEQLLQGRQTRSMDLFSLGCVLFYCITRGRHPFGDRLERDVNIVKNQKDLFLVEFIPEADDLISRLLNPDPGLRPKAIEVLHHPFFWSYEMRLSFLRDTSDRVELEDRKTDSDLLKALESIALVALGAKWDEKVEPAFITNMGRYRRYKYDSVRDLLRVMRNKLNHYRELTQEIQKLVGPVPEGFNDYFASRFPRLLIEVYKIISKYCKEEECFRRYFNNVD